MKKKSKHSIVALHAYVGNDDEALKYVQEIKLFASKCNQTVGDFVLDAVEAYCQLNLVGKMIGGKRSLLKLRSEFDEPIVALQDGDWELPDVVVSTFYGVYNMIDALTGKEQTVFNESTIYVSVNQLADALDSSKTMGFNDINRILDEVKRNNNGA